MSNSYEKTPSKSIPSLQTLATNATALNLANKMKEMKELDKVESGEEIKDLETAITTDKSSVVIVFVLDNTASQNPSWRLIKSTIRSLIPFLDSRHGPDKNIVVDYDIQIIYANDYSDMHLREAGAAKRLGTKYIADPLSSMVIGTLCEITSKSTLQERRDFFTKMDGAVCSGGGDRAEAYAPALALASEKIKGKINEYGDKAVVSCIFCGDDIPHGCDSQLGSRDSWPDGDPSGIDWYKTIGDFPVPIHCLSPPHADLDSKCNLGYASKTTGGFHLSLAEDSGQVLLRILMSEMKLSWLVERNIKDMEGASPEEIAIAIAEIVNKESFERATDTVSEDPRIEQINKEISSGGYSPGLFRQASQKIRNTRQCSMPPRALRSSTASGVSEGCVYRALKTASGGILAPSMMRMVSDSVVTATRREVISALMEGLDEEEDEEEEVDPVLLMPPPLVRSRPFPNLRAPAAEF